MEVPIEPGPIGHLTRPAAGRALAPDDRRWPLDGTKVPIGQRCREPDPGPGDATRRRPLVSLDPTLKG